MSLIGEAGWICHERNRIGVQGGDIKATVHAGRTQNNTGMMINSARAILYSSSGDDWAEAAAKTARATRSAIRAALDE